MSVNAYQYHHISIISVLDLYHVSYFKYGLINKDMMYVDKVVYLLVTLLKNSRKQY